ncbi:MAG: SDR family oxidoreductase [Mesorhizobium sp.]|nr:SDR family oxidoreductase [Mesorhizobium sp.]MBN9245620.1 SDR family oxidoreductase [Mesorhizobium sp.]
MTTDTPTLAGKQIVIFGGSSGIGLATAVAAKRRGAAVTLVGRTPAKLATAACILGGAGTIEADLGRRESIEAVFEAIPELDHLVITAGGIHAGKLSETDPDDLLVEVNEHIAGSLYAVKAAMPRMRPQGSVVLMGGQFSDRPAGNGTSVMALACRGIEALARALALEYKPARFNVIAPGFVETPIYDAFGSEVRAAILSAAAASLPVGRIGQPQEIADAILFLLGNGYVNCEVLHVDGGGRFA